MAWITTWKMTCNDEIINQFTMFHSRKTQLECYLYESETGMKTLWILNSKHFMRLSVPLNLLASMHLQCLLFWKVIISFSR